MALKNSEQIVVIGHVAYVPPDVYKSWTVLDQVKYVSTQAKLGVQVELKRFKAADLTSVEELLNLHKLNHNGFVKLLSDQNPTISDQLFRNLHNNLNEISETLEEIRKSLLKDSDYAFSKIPENYSFKDISITPSRVSRTYATIKHAMTIKQFKTLFNLCLEVWKDGKKGISTNYMDIGGYSRSLTISDKDIKVGCQLISKIEMEYVAIKLGFTGNKFPI